MKEALLSLQKAESGAAFRVSSQREALALMVCANTEMAAAPAQFHHSAEIIE